jgi:mannose-6-phosphate isomerase-like protein (cupin superfamily)
MQLQENDWVSGFTTMTIKSNNWFKVLVFTGTIFPLSAVAQNLDLRPIRTAQISEPVEVYPLAGDSLVSSFLIYVNEQVKPHYHELHSEHVMVLEGQGIMVLGDSVFTVNAGDFLFIPKGTVHSVSKTSEVPLKVISIQAPNFDGKDRVLFPPKR